MSDPFARRHAKPRDRRALYLIMLALLIGAAMLLTVGGIAKASTTPQPTVRGLVHALATGATIGVDNVTVRAYPVSVRVKAGHYPTRGYARACRAFARWNAAGIPSWGQLRTLAHSAAVMDQGSRAHLLPNDTLQADVAYLVLSVVAHTDGSRAAVVVAHDCGND